jgi:hypothetical protein
VKTAGHIARPHFNAPAPRQFAVSAVLDSARLSGSTPLNIGSVVCPGVGFGDLGWALWHYGGAATHVGPQPAATALRAYRSV